MATERQIHANRLNAQRSTGPRTEEGKARSRLNALRSGIDSNSILLPGEDPAQVQQLQIEYYDHHQPVTPDERDTLDSVVHAVCLMRRLRTLDAQLTKHEMDSIPDLNQSAPLGHVFSNASRKFVHLQQRMSAAERSFHRNLDRLHDLQSLRPEPADPVPGDHPQPAETETPTPQSASNCNSQPDPPAPPRTPPPFTHSARPEDCPHCRVVGFISHKCPYLSRYQQYIGDPLPGHPRIEHCPNCRNLGYVSPNCHYILKEPRE